MSTNPGGLVGPDEVREQLNLIEEIKSRFGVDDDFLAAVLSNQITLARIEDRENDLLQQLVDLNRAITPQGEIIHPESFTFEFSTNVPADTPTKGAVETVREIPFDARMRALIVGWPDGADNLVGVQFRTQSGEKLFPRNAEDDYVAANNFTHAFGIRTDVQEDEELVAQFINNDTTNNHFINVMATLEARGTEGV